MKIFFRLFLLLSVSIKVFAQETLFTRELNFNEGWKFTIDNVVGFQNLDIDDKGWRSLNLPHDWSIEGEFDKSCSTGASGGFLPAGIGYYRKGFTLPDAFKGKRIIIRFDGVYMNSSVYINGTYLGTRPYGFSTFEYDLTPYIKTGTETNLIAVKVDNSLQPGSRWYTGSGINRDVHLFVLSQQHIKSDGIFFTTKKKSDHSAEVNVSVDLVSDRYKESQTVAYQAYPGDIKRVTKSCILKTEILDRTGKIVATGESTFPLSDYEQQTKSLNLTVNNAQLWSDKSPYLYHLNCLLFVAGTLADEQSLQVGIRTIKFDKDSGMLVNGIKTIIKGVCLHKDAGSFGTAVPKDVYRYRLAKLKVMGCNAIRMHGPADPNFISVCDEMGFFFMAESFDEWNKTWEWGSSADPQGKNPYAYHLYFNQWAETDLKTMVGRDRNHASVFIYSVGNEVPDQRYPDGAATLSKLRSWVRDIDTTRPVVAACDWAPFDNANGFFDNMDLAGYNYIDRYYPGMYAEQRKTYPKRIYLGTETYPDEQNWLAVRDNPFVTGEFLWVGIDYLGEAGQWPRRGWEWGLIDVAAFEKPTYYIRQSYWSEKPMAHIVVDLKKKDSFKWRGYSVTSTWNFNPGEIDTVRVYSNCKHVELFLNHKSLGKKPVDKNSYCAIYSVSYQPGVLIAKAGNNSKIIAVDTLATASSPYRLTLKAEKTQVKLANNDLAFITVEVQDINGIRCPNATNNVRLSVKGSGKLIGLDSGDQFSHERYKSENRNAYEGRLLVTIAPTTNGLIEVECEGAGLPLNKNHLTIRVN